jgi:ketosteroid isomerase-like protein
MEQEITACEEKFLQALRSSDLKGLLEMLHDDLIYNHLSGEVWTKQMDLDSFKAANPVIERVDCIDRKIEVFGDTAIVSTAIYLKGIFGGHQIEGKTRFLRTWKRFEDGWKIIAAAQNQL